MNYWLEYLSGNVPGGIYLYLLIIFATFLVFFFMYRVNELFTRKHLTQWTLLSLILYSIIYIVIWFNDPPHFVYKRYSISIFQSNTYKNWFGEYLTDIVSQSVQPYVSEREYFFPYKWLYRITPLDSGENPYFARHIARTLPIQTVLSGRIIRKADEFKANIWLYSSQSGDTVKMVEGDFKIGDLVRFLIWLKKNFSGEIPFQDTKVFHKHSPQDSIFILARRSFFKGEFEKSLKVLQSSGDDITIIPLFNLWYQYIQIKLAGRERQQNPPINPYDDSMPQWKRDLQSARTQLLNFLKSGEQSILTNLLVAESYIWEEEFSAAEIFLKKAYIDNHFDIDVLLNLTFLHPSRYREFGFKTVSDIYEQILTFCPIEEEVLLKWSDFILQGNPAYTAPPKFAKNFVERYKEIKG